MTADAAPPPAASASVCASLPESRAYLAGVHDRAMARWEARDGDAGSVVIAFAVDRQGELVYSEVRSAPSVAIGRDAQRALAAASPYPPMPEPAQCLAGLRLVATFRLGDSGPPTGDDWLARVRWIQRLSWAAMLALGLGLAAWATRRGEESDAPTSPADPEAARLAPGETESFFRSTSVQALHVMALLHATLIVSRSPITIGALVLLDLFVVVEIIRWRRVPMVRVSAAEIEIDSSVLSATKCLSTTEISSWATTRTMLGLRTVRGDLVRVPLSALRNKDQKRLLALVRGLSLAPSPDPPLTAADLQRRQRRQAFVIIILAIGAAALLAELLWQ